MAEWVAGADGSALVAGLQDAAGDRVEIISQGATTGPELLCAQVVRYRVPVANRRRFRKWQPSIVAAHLRTPGFVSAEYHPPMAGDEGGWTAVIRFESQAALDGWRESEERRRLIDELDWPCA